MNGVIKDSLILTISKTVSKVSMLLTTMIAARYLAISENGILREVTLIITLAVSILPWGIPITVSYYYRNLNKGNKDKLFSNSFISSTAIGLVTMVIYLIISSIRGVSPLYGDSILLNIFFGLALAAAIAASFMENLYISSNHSTQLGIINAITYIMYSGLASFFIIMKRDLSIVLLIMFITEVIKDIILYMYIYQKEKFRIHLDLTFLIEQLQYSFPVGLSSIIQTLSIYIDSIFIIVMFDHHDYGIYSAGAWQIPLISIVTVSLATTSLPKMSKIYNLEKNVSKLIRLWKEVTIAGAVIIFPAFWLFFFFNKGYIDFVFSPRYYPAIPIFLVYLLKLPLSCTTFNNILLVMKKQKSIVLNSSVSVIANVMFNFFFIWLFGMIGAAISSFLMHILVICLQLYQIRKHTGYKIKYLLPFKKLFILMTSSGMLFIILYMISIYAPINNFFKLVVFGGTGYLLSMLLYNKMNLMPVKNGKIDFVELIKRKRASEKQ